MRSVAIRASALLIACLALLVPAASASSTLTVYAASSLTDVFPAIDSNAQYSFAGSNALAAQIELGAPADIFASANTSIPATLYAKGLVEQPVDFTRNTLVIVVPTSNPGGIHSIYDLTKPGVSIAIAAAAVPVGSYTREVLGQMNLTSQVMANVVSEDSDVRDVLSQVALGQVDAGFVYSTDAKTVPGQVDVVTVPVWAQPKVTYALAVVTASPNQAAANAFIAQVLSKAGQAKLLSYGFLPLTKPKERIVTKPPHRKR
ncbi:MAG: molybdate ABC transporter substrate-binding protein [Solirubrobacteraceae bacterium]|jgi:molybdate transport system substrate-binding protein